MLRTVKALDGVVVEVLVNADDAAGLGVRSAAAADERVDRVGIHALRLEHVQDHAAPERHLVVDVRKLQKLGRFVEELPLEDRRLVLEEADLRRSRAWVDNKQPEFAVFHFDLFYRKVDIIPYPALSRVASKGLDEVEDLCARRVRLLLVDLGRDDAGVFHAPVVENAMVLADCTVIDIGRIG